MSYPNKEDMSLIKRNIDELRRSVPAHVRIIAVSKTKSAQDILAAYEGGQRDFGENYVQELVEKVPQLPKDIIWHVIGHLQTNKVKYVAPFIHYIHSVDSEKILLELEKQADKNNRTIKCLLQFHIASEESKFGFPSKNYHELLDGINWNELPHLEICGVMGMASFVENQLQLENEFKSLIAIFNDVKSRYFSQNTSFVEISMGMSTDWPLAVENGSTMIRIGSSIFGGRI